MADIPTCMMTPRSLCSHRDRRCRRAAAATHAPAGRSVEGGSPAAEVRVDEAIEEGGVPGGNGQGDDGSHDVRDVDVDVLEDQVEHDEVAQVDAVGEHA